MTRIFAPPFKIFGRFSWEICLPFPLGFATRIRSKVTSLPESTKEVSNWGVWRGKGHPHLIFHIRYLGIQGNLQYKPSLCWAELFDHFGRKLSWVDVGICERKQSLRCCRFAPLEFASVIFQCQNRTGRIFVIWLKAGIISAHGEVRLIKMLQKRHWGINPTKFHKGWIM